MTRPPRRRRDASEVSDAARQFMELVALFSYQQGPRAQSRGLTNFTFFAGAGFSKSWDPRAPVGRELFTVSSDLIETVADVSALSRMFGLENLEAISPSQLRQIIYQNDMYERYPDVRSRYVDEQNLQMFRAALRASIVDRYDQITKLTTSTMRA